MDFDIRMRVLQKNLITLFIIWVILFSCKREIKNISTMEQLRQTKIVALGDSITYGFPLGRGWLYYLAKNHRVELVNSGANGETLEQFYSRIEEGVIAHQPKYCIIMGGTNDVAHGISIAKMQNYFLKIISILQKVNIKPIVGIPILSTAKEIEEPLGRFREYVRQLGFPIIDFASLFYNEVGGHKKIKLAWLPDQVHPSEEGYKAMAHLALRRLKEIISNDNKAK